MTTRSPGRPVLLLPTPGALQAAGLAYLRAANGAWITSTKLGAFIVQSCRRAGCPMPLHTSACKLTCVPEWLEAHAVQLGFHERFGTVVMRLPLAGQPSSLLGFRPSRTPGMRALPADVPVNDNVSLSLASTQKLLREMQELAAPAPPPSTPARSVPFAVAISAASTPASKPWGGSWDHASAKLAAPAAVLPPPASPSGPQAPEAGEDDLIAAATLVFWHARGRWVLADTLGRLIHALLLQHGLQHPPAIQAAAILPDGYVRGKLQLQQQAGGGGSAVAHASAYRLLPPLCESEGGGGGGGGGGGAHPPCVDDAGVELLAPGTPTFNPTTPRFLELLLAASDVDGWEGGAASGDCSDYGSVDEEEEEGGGGGTEGDEGGEEADGVGAEGASGGVPSATATAAAGGDGAGASGIGDDLLPALQALGARQAACGLSFPTLSPLALDAAGGAVAAARAIVSQLSSANLWTTRALLEFVARARGLHDVAAAASSPQSLRALLESSGLQVARISCGCLDDTGYRYTQLGSEPPTAPQPPPSPQHLTLAVLVAAAVWRSLFVAAPGCAAPPLTQAALQHLCACWGVAPTAVELAALLQ